MTHQKGKYFMPAFPAIVLMALLSILPVFSEPVQSSSSELESFGLQGKTVTSLYLYRNSLYAGTENEGVYRRDLTQPDSGWVYLGLPGVEITSVYVFHKFCPFICYKTILAAVKPKRNEGDSTLIYAYTTEEDSCNVTWNWIPSDSGISASQNDEIRGINGFSSCSSVTDFVVVFAATNGSLYKSVDRGTSWEEVLESDGINVIRADWSRELLWNGIVWIGGETGFFQPYLAKSSDEGTTWEFMFPDMGGDNACNSIAVHPEQPDTVYAGMEGAVIKTIDGGTTWKFTGLKNTPVSFYGLVIEPSAPEHLYAGGTIPNDNTFALYETFDGGDNWQAVSFPDTLKGISSLALDTNQRILYIATFGSGVWRAQSMAVGIQETEGKTMPANFILHQNYPNPFNPETIIEFGLPTDTHVKITIYDLLGRELKVLVNGYMLSGNHFTTWDGKDAFDREAANGIYFYKLSTERSVLVKKMAKLK